MDRLIVYTSLTSPYGRAVRVCLEERRVEHELIPLTREERAMAVNLARNPFAKIPVLDHDGFILYETQAIVRYLGHVFPGESLIPEDPRLEARMNQAISIIDAYFFTQVSSPIAGERIGAKLFGTMPDEDKIKAHLPKARTCMAALDTVLGNNDFMAGDRFSFADIFVMPHLGIFELTPEGRAMLPEFPRLQRWLAEVRQRDSFRSTEPPVESIG
jgi:glutathione S-transferase